MKIEINVLALQSRYPEQTVQIVEEGLLISNLASLGIVRQTQIPTTELILSDNYRLEINRLCDELINHGFPGPKAEILRSRFINTHIGINNYFSLEMNQLNSIPLAIAGHIRSKMEEILYVLMEMEPALRSKATAVASQDAYACSDGTLQNLESLFQSLSGACASINFFVAAVKREIIEARLQDAYQKRLFAPGLSMTNPGQEIHIVASLINTIANNFGLAIKSKTKYPYIMENIPPSSTHKTQMLASQALTESSENLQLVARIADKVFEKLPPEPGPGASDEMKKVFTENLNQFFTNLGLGTVEDLTFTQTIYLEYPEAVEKYPMTVSIQYTPYAYAALLDLITLHLLQDYKKEVERLIPTILSLYGESDFQAIQTLMVAEKIYNINIFGSLISQIATIKADKSLTPHTQRNLLRQTIGLILDEPMRKIYRTMMPSESEGDDLVMLLKQKIEITRSVSDWSEITSEPTFNECWETIISRKYPLCSNRFGTRDALKYAIDNKLMIHGRPFLAALHIAGIRIDNLSIIDYIAEHASEEEVVLLRGSFDSADDVIFSKIENDKTIEFLLAIGVEDIRVNPDEKLEIILTQGECYSQHIDRIISLLSKCTSIDTLALAFVVGVDSERENISLTAKKRVDELNLKNFSPAILCVYFTRPNMDTLIRILDHPDFIIQETIHPSSEDKINSVWLTGFSLATAQELDYYFVKLNNTTLVKPYLVYLIRAVMRKNLVEHLEIIEKHFGAGQDIFPRNFRYLMEFAANDACSNVLSFYLSKFSEKEIEIIQSKSTLEFIFTEIKSVKNLNSLLGRIKTENWHKIICNKDMKKVFESLLTPVNGMDNPVLSKLLECEPVIRNFFSHLKISKIMHHIIFNPIAPSPSDYLKYFLETIDANEKDLIIDLIIKVNGASRYDRIQTLLRDVLVSTNMDEFIEMFFYRDGKFIDIILKCLHDNSEDEKISIFVALKRILDASESVQAVNYLKLAEIQLKVFPGRMSDSFNIALKLFDKLPEDEKAQFAQSILNIIETKTFFYSLEVLNNAGPSNTIYSDIYSFMFSKERQSRSASLNHHLDKAYSRILKLQDKNMLKITLWKFLDYRQIKGGNSLENELTSMPTETYISYLRLLFAPNPDSKYIIENHTILHFSLGRKCLKTVESLIEMSTKTVTHELLNKPLKSETLESKKLYDHFRAKFKLRKSATVNTAITPSGYAKYIDFPQAIPVMFVVAYEHKPNLPLPRWAEDFIKDPILDEGDHRAILTLLSQKFPDSLSRFDEIYRVLPANILTVFQSFRQKAGESSGVGSKRGNDEANGGIEKANTKKYKKSSIT